MAVEKARKQVACCIGASEKEVFWTSGATESNNMAILGVARHHLDRGEKVHIITSPVEHKAVLDVCKSLSLCGAEVSFVPTDNYGMVHPDAIEKEVRPHTRLISIMMANNEVGTINPIEEIGVVARKYGVLFHTDAAQSAGKIPINVDELSVDMLSISAHKIYGPKGVGALFIKEKDPHIELRPLMCGGTQERGLRPGTLNVPGIVGLGKALELAQEEMQSESLRLTGFQQKILATLTTEIPNIKLNGHPQQRLYNNLSFSFSDLSADVFALGLSGLALSSGSACTSDSGEVSHVLKAMGLDNCLARATVRIGLGRFTKPDDVDLLIKKICQMAKKSKEISVI